MKTMIRTVLTTLVCGLVATASFADDVAEAISADGETVTGSYESVADAIAACESGGTVRLLADVTITVILKVSRDLTVDLNDHKLSSSNVGVFVTDNSAPATLTVINGMLDSNRMLFQLNRGDLTVNVRDCSLTGSRVVQPYATVAEPGSQVNIYDSTVNMTYLGSSGVATLNIYSGEATVANWFQYPHDEGNETLIRLYGGTYTKNPRSAETDGRQVVADGCMVQGHWQKPWNVWTVRARDEFSVVSNGYGFPGFNEAVTASDGDSCIELIKDCTVEAYNKATKDIDVDLGGHTLDGYALLVGPVTCRISNGTLTSDEKGWPLVDMSAGGTLVASNVVFRQTEGKQQTAVKLGQTNAVVTVVGGSVTTDYLLSGNNAETLATCSLTVQGDGENLCTRFNYDNICPEGFAFAIRGGRWTFDPSANVPQDSTCVVLYKSGATPCAYRVLDFDDLAANGFKVSLDDPLNGAAALAGRTVAAPAGMIAVTLDAAPERRTIIADFSNAFPANAAQPVFELAEKPSKHSYIAYAAGTLSAFESRAFVITIR